jgi:hypothetical protein
VVKGRISYIDISVDRNSANPEILKQCHSSGVGRSFAPARSQTRHIPLSAFFDLFCLFAATTFSPYFPSVSC